MKQDVSKGNSLGYLIHEVAKLMKRRFEDEARGHGVTLPQWRALAEIQRSEAISQVVLAGCIDTDPMTVSGILDRLEKRGLIVRFADPNDSRAKLASLTEAGQDLVAIARNVRGELLEKALAGLTAAEHEALSAGLQRIRDNLNTMSAEQKEAV